MADDSDDPKIARNAGVLPSIEPGITALSTRRKYETTVRGRRPGQTVDDVRAITPQQRGTEFRGTNDIDDPKIARNAGILPRIEPDDIGDPKIARNAGVLPKIEPHEGYSPTPTERGLAHVHLPPAIQPTAKQDALNYRVELLKEGARKLTGIQGGKRLNGFGVPVPIKEVDGELMIGKEGQFDTEFWEPLREQDPTSRAGKLRLKEGKNPSAALR